MTRSASFVCRLMPALAAALLAGVAAAAADESGPALAHVVFFTLKDHSGRRGTGWSPPARST